MAMLAIRRELYPFVNHIDMQVRHFARGYFPVRSPDATAMPVNRLFSVLDNPGGSDNHIADTEVCHALLPGGMYFVPAFHPARFRLDERLLFVSIQFNLEYFPGVDLLGALKRTYAWMRPGAVARLDRIFADGDRMRTAIELKHAIYAVSRDLVTSAGGAIDDPTVRFASYRAVFEHAGAHGTAAMRVASLAKCMGMSREAFTRRFTADTGMTPKAFLDRQLARRAVDLLRDPQTGAKEIAAALDFSSEYAFSRFFKRMFGIPPGAYRTRAP